MLNTKSSRKIKMKRNNILKLVLLALIVAPSTATVLADDSSKQQEPAKSRRQLLAHVESLYADQVAWRSIPWKTCLLDGIRESRAQHKPIVLWIFIDRPIDDERC